MVLFDMYTYSVRSIRSQVTDRDMPLFCMGQSTFLFSWIWFFFCMKSYVQYVQNNADKKNLLTFANYLNVCKEKYLYRPETFSSSNSNKILHWNHSRLYNLKYIVHWIFFFFSLLNKLVNRLFKWYNNHSYNLTPS